MGNNLTFGIRLTADGKQFAGEVKLSRDELDKLGVSAGKTGSTARQFGRDAEDASKRAAAGFGKARDGADAFAVQLDKLKGLALSYIGVSQAIGFTKSLIDSTVAMDAFNAKMAIALNSSKYVAAEYEYLAGLSNRLGTEVRSTADAYASFAAAARGTALEGAKAREVFTGVATASARMSLTADAQRGVFLALSQMMSKGVVSAEEFRQQLGERLPVATTAGAAALGVTTAEFVKMLNSGELLSEEFLPKFAAQLEKMAGDGGPVDNMQASLNRLSNQWTEFHLAVSKSAALQDGADWLAGLAAGATDVANEVNRAQQEYGTLFALFASVGLSMAKVAGVEIDPQKRAQAELNLMLKEQLRLKADIADPSKRGGFYDPEKFKADAKEELAALNARIKAQIELVNAPINAAGAAAAKRRHEEEAQAAEREKTRKKTLSEDQLKAIEAEKKAYDSLIAKLGGGLVDATVAAQAAQHGYNSAQADALKMFASPVWAKMDEKKRMEVAGILDATIAQVKENDARKQAAQDHKQLLKDIEKAQDDADKAMRDSALEAQRIIFDIDPIARASAEWEKLTELVNKGLLTQEQAAKAYAKEFGDSTVQMDGYAKKLADNIQSNLGDVLYDGLNGKFDDIGSVFKQMLARMAADAASAQLTQAMFGNMSATGQMGGWAGQLAGLFGGSGGGSSGFVDVGGFAQMLSFDGGGYTGPGSRSGGIDGKGGFLSVLHPRETVIDHTRGQSAGAVINITSAPVIHIDSRTDRAEVSMLVSRAVQQGNAALVDRLQRAGALA